MQEVVRRLEHCSSDLQRCVRNEVLTNFAQKMINSGHSMNSTRITIVHGVLKYQENVMLDKLPYDHKQYRPLYLYKRYNEYERQLEKKGAKTGWYGEKEDDERRKRRWREGLRGAWRGGDPLQRKIKGIRQSTVLQVPSSKGSRLLVALARNEPKIAKLTGYHTKLTEKSGVQLSRLFTRVTVPKICDWEKCGVCLSGGDRCRQQNVVYRGTCQDCLEEVERKEREKDRIGVYIDETGRSLAERSSEHLKKLDDSDRDNFILRHWALEHQQKDEAPRIEFRVIKNHRDCLSRLLHEAVMIEEEGTMNAKSEWRQNRRAKLTVELVGKDKKKKKCGTS